MILTSDTEITTWNMGSAFDNRNFLVCNAWKIDNEPTRCDPTTTDDFNFSFKKCTLIVLFNAKFDLHWYRRQGLSLNSINVWCCQLAEFYLENQRNTYPSLEETAVKYGLGHKIDVIKTNYWDKGINTNEIPTGILYPYAIQDVDLTYKIYLEQVKQFKTKPALYKLFRLACQDLLVLQEMEWNGLKVDTTLMQKTSEELDEKIKTVLDPLKEVYPNVVINFGSGYQLSSFLYGGTIKEEFKEHCGFYKTGAKAGQPKYKWVEKETTLPRLIEPIKGSDLAKEGFFATNEDVLKKLKGPNAKKFVAPLLEYAKLEKLNSTYYKGMLTRMQEYNWTDGVLHGQFNQCVTITGRLSSSKPNQQNLAGDCLNIFISRF